MISVPVSSAVNCRFVPRSGQNKDYKMGIYFILRYTHIIKEKEQRLAIDVQYIRVYFEFRMLNMSSECEYD